LEGYNRELAKKIWDKTNHQVNPSHMYGTYMLINHYELLKVDAQGRYEITERGKNFLENPRGEVEKEIDLNEGLFKILEIVARTGRGKISSYYKDWELFNLKYTKNRKRSYIKDSLRRRLNNLIDRGCILREGINYEITPEGLEYLKERPKLEGEIETFGDEIEVAHVVKRFDRKQREKLLDILYKIDPYDFEKLISQLIENMGYQNVEVTARTGDKGIDVVGEIEVGITSVKEVIQAKRTKGNIQRKVLDALRGSLHRYGAIRGTIITTSNFSKGAKEAAFEMGAPPITLINGKKLIDLLIEHEIGVEKLDFSTFKVDEDFFEELGEKELTEEEIK
jgi:restriction system protein